MFEYPKDNWDANSSRLKDLLPVYVKLEGSRLVLTGTKTRIPMRMMWNEPPLDPVFTSRREFDITGCPVYLLPFTLSRGRHVSTSFPSSLILLYDRFDEIRVASSWKIALLLGFENHYC
jgi:hypothetical protein